jgi:hypothetical protein
MFFTHFIRFLSNFPFCQSVKTPERMVLVTRASRALTSCISKFTATGNLYLPASPHGNEFFELFASAPRDFHLLFEFVMVRSQSYIPRRFASQWLSVQAVDSLTNLIG